MCLGAVGGKECRVNMKDKVLTISVASYNVEKYIKNTIESCINIDIIDDIELLIIDDGGNDKTVEIASIYSKKYPNSIRIIHKENGGYGSTINTGIKIANGKYFKQLDGDDWFDNQGLVEHIKLLKKISVDMILTPNIKYFETTMKKIIRDNCENYAEGMYNFNEINFRNNINMHSITYRTSLLRNEKIFITENCFYTDTEFVIKPLQFVNSIYISHVPLYMYRIGVEGQSISVQGLIKHIDDHYKVLYNIIDTLDNSKENNISNSQINLIEKRVVTEIANHITYLLLFPVNSYNKEKIKHFVKEIDRDYNDLLKQAINQSRVVKVLIIYKYIFYSFLHKYVLRKYNN